MALVKLRPTSPGRRSVVKLVNKELHKGSPHKSPIISSFWKSHIS